MKKCSSKIDLSIFVKNTNSVSVVEDTSFDSLRNKECKLKHCI
jgi:hypothetical protein